MKIQIGNHVIGENSPCYIIAEIGLNHNGNIDTARKSIAEAARVGANAVKFQKRTTKDILIQEYLDRPYSGQNSYGATYGEHRDALELPDEVWPELCKMSQDLGMDCFASPWDIKSADFLETLDVPAYKIASGDLTNLPLLKHVAAKGKPVILSTGMSTIDEVEEAVRTITGINVQLILLHCISTYPFDDRLANLSLIGTLREQFPQTVIGYSGHEKSGHIISLAAAILGAKVIERHFTLDRTMRGPDHAASLEPHGFGLVVENIRKVEGAMGNGIKRILEDEMVVREKLSKSIVSTCEIKAGTIITLDMLTVKSPGNGILPRYLDDLCGKKAQVDVLADSLLPKEAVTWPTDSKAE
jgi:sialic acid synthase SpsE